MAESLHELEDYIAGLLGRLEPGQRRKALRAIATELRREQAEHIGAQRNPDGSPYAPRKDREPVRGKDGRIKAKERRRKMFRKIRTGRWLRAESSPDQLQVGFPNGPIARIGRVHQLGLRDKVTREPGGPEATYPARVLIGFTEASPSRILDALTRALGD